VSKALREADADEFVSKLPLKSKSKGCQEQLSGGEQQRVSIARALVRDTSRVRLVALDEATSAVDVETERRIQSSLAARSAACIVRSSPGESSPANQSANPKIIGQNSRHRRATCIAVAHRLSTVRHADRILVLDKGRLVEQGTWEELMRTSTKPPQQAADAQPVAMSSSVFHRLVAAQEVRGAAEFDDEEESVSSTGAMMRAHTDASSGTWGGPESPAAMGALAVNVNSWNGQELREDVAGKGCNTPRDQPRDQSEPPKGLSISPGERKRLAAVLELLAADRSPDSHLLREQAAAVLETLFKL
jgi:ABC-type multidrug transport system ATPase subunit